MARIRFDQQTVELQGTETVLDALLRSGVAVPNSCRAGACQSCMMRCTDVAPPPASQAGLKDSLKSQGYFLSCICQPATDLSVALAADVLTRATARVTAIDRLSADVARVRLICSESFTFRPGQFANVIRADGLSRPYSIASLPGEPIELHVRRVPGGQLSSWFYEHCATGTTLELRGPVGDCFYTAGNPEQPIALIGTGTGLAPLYAIARDALKQGHTGPIRLYHGALDPSGLYYADSLHSIARAHANFSYTPCAIASPAESNPAIRIGDLEQIVQADIRSFKGWRVYLCGNPKLVQSLRKKVFLAGAAMEDIHSDAFVMRQSA